MALRNAASSDLSAQMKRVVWTGMVPGDTANMANITGIGLLGASMQVQGMGTGSLALHGSNDGTNFYPLKDAAGNVIAVTANGLVEIASTAVLYVKPVLTGGGADNVTVTLVSRA